MSSGPSPILSASPSPSPSLSSPLPHCLLAFDTATETMHVALLAGEQLRVAALSGGAQASATAMPGVQAMLADAGLAWADVQAVAFGQGPGAFTGLRTACALAQGLALALDVPVVPLDTLMAVAESARLRSSALAAWLATPPSPAAAPPCLWVLQDARMQEVYAAAYAWSAEQGWCVREPASLWCLVELQSHIQMGHVHWAAGSALAAYPAHTQGLANADPVACPEGAALAVLAQSAWHRGQCVDAALALPVYVRDKVAQTTQERTQARDAAVALDAARHT